MANLERRELSRRAPLPMTPFNPTASEGRVVAPWLAWLLTVLFGLVTAAAAAWWGYRLQQQTWGDPAAIARSAARPASSSTTKLSDAAQNGQAPEPTIGQARSSAAASPSNAANGLSWPFWEFRLRLPIPPRTPSLTPPTWRMIGASLSGGAWSVIVLQQDKSTPEYFKVGQDLPGNYRIDSIDDEGVTLTQGKRKMVLSYINSR